jgi:hypothetical protein
VLWTPHSILSDWVISEAEHAALHNILIPIRVPDLDPAKIPKPFAQRQTELLDNRGAIVAALKRLGVEPRYAPGVGGSLHDRFWKEIEESEHPEDYELYLKEFPEGPHVAFARLKIARLRRVLPLAADQSDQQTTAGRVAAPVQIAAFGVLLLLAAALVGTSVWQNQQLSALRQDFTEQRLSDKLAELMDKVRAVAVEVEKPRAADDADWAKVEATNLISGWTAYLRRRPAGFHAEEAEARIKSRLANGRTVAVLQGHDATIIGLEFDLDGNVVTSRSENGWTYAWNIAKKEIAHKSRGDRRDLTSLAKPVSLRAQYGSDSAEFRKGRFVIGHTANYEFYFQDGVGSIALDKSFSNTADFTATILGERFALVAVGEVRYLIDFVGRRTWKFSAKDTLTVNAVAIDRSQSRLMVAGGRQIRFLRSGESTAQIVLEGHTANVDALALSDDGLVAASGGEDRTVRIWDLSDL